MPGPAVEPEPAATSAGPDDLDWWARGYLDRRAFLRAAGLAGGAAAYDAALARARPVTSVVLRRLPQPVRVVAGEIESVLAEAKPSFVLVLRRREDFVFILVEGFNLVRRGQRLVRKSAHHDAHIVFTFEPQHLTEQAFPDPGSTPKAPGGSKALLAFPSRIAFKVPSGHSIPLTPAGLLDWQALEPSLPRAAAFVPPGLAVPRLSKPSPLETALELPWRLIIAPVRGAGTWSHPTQPVARGGFTELWHTRLAHSQSEAAADGGRIRAVWNYDVDKHGRPTLNSTNPPAFGNNSPFITSLTIRDRWEIVRATSDFALSGRADVQVNRLWLSARGGFLDSIGRWDSTDIDIAEWKHQATLGRDQYVKVVTKGFLYPFGHRAVFTTVVERKFELVAGQIVATFRRYQYVVVRQPTVGYAQGQTHGIADDSRDFPFRSVTIKTARTPHLPPQQAFVSGLAGPVFVPSLAAADPFLWHCAGIDWSGQEVEFTTPAVFVDQGVAFNASQSTAVRNHYNGLAVTDAVRVGKFHGHEVAMAAQHTPGDTNLGVQTITFGAGAGTGPTSGGVSNAFKRADQPICFPKLAQAEVVLSAAAQAAGGAPLSKNPIVAYHDTYVAGNGSAPGGFNTAANRGNVFMEIVKDAPGLIFSDGSSGGLITPNLALAGLSRSLGPVAGNLDDLLAGKFDPASVFAGVLDATILGGVKLSTLIKVATGIAGDNPIVQAMRIVYSTAAAASSANTATPGHLGARLTPPIPETRTTHFHWEPEINSTQSVPIVTSTGNTSLVLDGLVTTDLLHPQKSTYRLNGDLKNFAVSLMQHGDPATEFITVSFNELTFAAASGQKPKVTVDIAGVTFDGPLKFVEQLEHFMDFSGDGGPKIKVLPSGVSADLSVALPPIAIGVMSLSNVGIAASFNLPFTGKPARFRFSFSTRDDPFTLSVSIFGGSGFFGLAVGTDGVEQIEASFDFGAMTSVNLGVASGAAQLVAGIYYSYGENDGKAPATCVLTGFVKLDGDLSILGLITMSLTFDMSLTYTETGSVSQVTGSATLTVSVSVLFFSFSVSVSASKTFEGGGDASSASLHQPRTATRFLVPAGSDSPPDFAAQMTASDWSSYCGAFAGG